MKDPLAEFEDALREARQTIETYEKANRKGPVQRKDPKKSKRRAVKRSRKANR